MRSLECRGNHVPQLSRLCLIGYCWPYRKALLDVSNGTANLRGRRASSVRRTGRSDHTRQSFMMMKHVSSPGIPPPGISPPPQDLPHWGKILQLPFSIRSQFPKEHTFYGPGKPLLGLFGNQLWFFSPDSINRILLCGAGTELRSLASWCDIPSSWDSTLSSPQEAKGSCALSCCVQLFFFSAFAK